MRQFSHTEWAALSRLLDEALDLPDQDREQWLAARRAENPTLAAELEALLARDARIEGDDFLSESGAPAMPREATLAGMTLGAYVLERPLGQGGMGSVWLARRSDGRFEGVAAIKFLSLAVAGPAGEARFRREGSMLARLAHPNIARLLDAGVSAAGLPYLVLEYVAGAPIDEWCDTHNLSVDARLRLFEQVLGAVAHAHANFIVHRDLKPDNILVTENGTVKLLDFGIAKLLDEGGALASTGSVTSDSAFTYRYAAPEQIKGDPITSATDVYALGVILYELLAGRHPTSEHRHTPAEHVVAILESEAAPLPRAMTSSATQSADQLRQLASLRDATPDRLRRVFAGDLDNITARALKKNPAERYPTVAALAQDIQSYLKHEPVSARADSVSYRARKFVRRNRAPVALAALAVLALAAAAIRESQLRGRAESEARKAIAVEQYLVSIFGAADPYAPVADKPSDVTARALLDRGADGMDTSLANEPGAQAELRGALGRVYANLGVYDKATVQLRRSLDERRALYGANSAQAAEAMDQLGEVLFKENDLGEADTLLRGALAIRRHLFGGKDETSAQSMDHLAALLQDNDKFKEAEPLFREALQVRRALYGDSDVAVATSRDYLGQLLQANGATPKAVVEYRAALAIRERRLGRDHPATAETLQNLASAEENLGDYADAERDYRAALDIERRTLGPEHRSVTLALNNFGQMLFKVGRLEEADSLLREALAINRKMLGETSEGVSANLSNLALIVRERGDFTEAENLLEQALAIDKKLYGEQHVNVGFDLNEIAVVLRLRGNPDSAITLLRSALAMSQKLVGEDQISTLTINVNLARALEQARHYDESERRLRAALAKLDTSNANMRLTIVPARTGLGRVLLATHRATEALPVLRSVVAMSRQDLGPDHWRTAETEMVLGRCYMALGELANAEASLRAGAAVLMKQRKAHPGLAKEADQATAELSRMQLAQR